MVSVQDAIILLQIAINNALIVGNGLIGRISNEIKSPNKADKIGKLQVLDACIYMCHTVDSTYFWSNTFVKLLRLFTEDQRFF